MLRRSSGELLLRAALASRDPTERQRVELFFSSLPHCSQASAGAEASSRDQLRREVRLVESEVGTHHFGNTAVGFKSARRPDGDASGSVIHIVNAETVRQLSKAAGLDQATSSDSANAKEREWLREGPLAPSRFRPNIVLAGLAAWSEFDWVGKHVQIGSVTLKVLSRTVRCDATNVDARAGSGSAILDVPELLKLHFPNHGPYLGVYAIVVCGGTLNVGDTVVGVVPDPLVVRKTKWQRQLWHIFFLISALAIAIMIMR